MSLRSSYGPAMKKLLSSIFIPKMAFIFMLAGSICSLSLVYFFYTKWQTSEDLKQTITQLQYKKNLREKVEQHRQKFYTQLETSDRFYIQNHVETFATVSPDKFDEDQISQSRLSLFRFEEKKSLRHENVEELELHQIAPIEVDVLGLKQLLCLVEGVPIAPYVTRKDRPQIIIKEFILECKEKKNIYSLEMDLIQRGSFLP